MRIPSSVIKGYLLSKFEDYDIAADEFMVNSLFCEDTKHHLSINLESGLWQCFKTKESGNFIQLVAMCEEVPYRDAYKVIGKQLLGSLDLLFSDPVSKQKQLHSTSSLSDEIVNFKPLEPIERVDVDRLSESLALRFVKSRKLNPEEFYFASSGRYANRLVIPYEDNSGIFYFQARHLLKVGMKYLNPTFREHGVKSSDILYPCNFSESYVVVTEGPIDAITLQEVGINATCTQGSMMSRKQVKQLKDNFSNIILSYDNDDAGMSGMNKSLNLMRKVHMGTPYVCRPPKRFKDWSDFYVAATKRDVQTFINSSVARLDYAYRVSEELR